MKTLLYPLALVSVLVVGPTYANDNLKSDVQDAWLDGKAETTILLNQHLNSFNINTDVKNGVIYLTGKVNSQVEKSLAGELVEDLEGVKRVDNQLVFLPENKDSKALGDDLTDMKIAAVVKTKLLMHSDVSGTNIEVEADNNIVTLAGQVDTKDERALAYEVIKNTADVKSIVNNISVAK